MKKHLALVISLALLIFLSIALLTAIQANASSTFRVNSTADAVDVSPGDGKCATASGKCTLRAAIMETNKLTGADTVILPAGAYTLTIAGGNAYTDVAAGGDLGIIDDLTLIGAGPDKTIINGNRIDRVFFVFLGLPYKRNKVSISGVTIRNGRSFDGSGGGGIYSVGETTMRNVVVSGNVSGDGGGIKNSGLMRLVDVTVSGNNAPQPTGGGAVAVGAGIANVGCMPDCGLTLDRVTVSRNLDGAAAIDNMGSMTVTNSTISGNMGGGIYDHPATATMHLRNVTIVNNGQYGFANVDPATLENVLLASNALGNCLDDMAQPLLNVTSLGHNLSSDTTCAAALVATGDQNNVDPLVGPLANNGGKTWTHALLSGSPAIDAGSLACPPPAADQRGATRPFDGNGDGTAACDIGAYEYGAEIPTPTATPTRTPTRTATPPAITVENENLQIQYDGWRGVKDSRAMGGTYRVSDTPNDSVRLAFTGSAVNWVTVTGPDQGTAKVSIDGVDKGTFDFYAPTYHFKSSYHFGGMINSAHIITVRVLGTKNANASGAKVSLDAFALWGVFIQDTSPLVEYGNWKNRTLTGPTGNSLRMNGRAGAAARFTFSGRGINWITARGPRYGLAEVWIDGVKQGNVIDLYDPTLKWQVAIPFAGLTDGQHTIEIRVLGDKNSASAGTSIVLDAFRGRFRAP